jgi:ribosomal-protein-alanine N-acetyltransferase
VAAAACDADGAAVVSARAIDAAAAPASLRPMREADLDAVMAIELRAYPFPWTRGIFRDCLLADYPARVLVQDSEIIGYGMLSVAADEAHVLNVCAAP